MKEPCSDICTKCGKRKDIKDFKKDKRIKRGYYKICKVCAATYSREKYLNNGWVGFGKWRNKREPFSHESYLQMLEEQQGCCAICRQKELSKKTRLFVDHDHKTGKIRGLLCHKCNAGLGMFSDSIDFLLKASQYLRGGND